jgi:hypothetical protein
MLYFRTWVTRTATASQGFSFRRTGVQQAGFGHDSALRWAFGTESPPGAFSSGLTKEQILIFRKKGFFFTRLGSKIRLC